MLDSTIVEVHLEFYLSDISRNDLDQSILWQVIISQTDGMEACNCTLKTFSLCLISNLNFIIIYLLFVCLFVCFSHFLPLKRIGGLGGIH